ncbi:MAG: hypothetical protein J5793_01750, partial [Clostridia bacterium]|nr:hypothetical protein [Clostridia bacterium]
MDGKENKKSTAVAAAVIIAAAVVLIAVYLVFVLAGGSSPSDTESGSLAPAESFEEESKEVEPPPELSVDGSEKLGDAEIGSLVLFGEYIQLPGSSEDGTSTPVEWIVLDKSEGEV